MCALFGWLRYKDIVPFKILGRLTQSLANAAEERGTDASGISYVKNGGITIYKRPKPAHKLRFNIPYGTKAVMGHTRLTTQGNEKLNFNNHPFLGHADRDFAFAHNGVLYNDTALRKEKNLPDTHIETDSYIGVQLIEQQGKLDFDSLKSMAEDVQGNFTFTLLDEENCLYIVKGSSPMYLIHNEALGLYIYASTKSIMINALKKTGMHKFRFSEIKTNDGDILKIDDNGIISRFKFEFNYQLSPLCRYYYNSDIYNSYYDDYYTMQEEFLLEVCGSFGVSEEDVITLLDYGYTADEVEEMLMDCALVSEIIKSIKGE